MLELLGLSHGPITDQTRFEGVIWTSPWVRASFKSEVPRDMGSGEICVRKYRLRGLRLRLLGAFVRAWDSP